MRIIFSCTLLLAVILAGCGGNSPSGSPNAPGSQPTQAPPNVAALVRLEDAHTFERDTVSGAILLVRDQNLSRDLERSDGYRELLNGLAYADMALAFIDHYRESFRFVDPTQELQAVRVQDDNLGYHHVRLSQEFSNLPVLDVELIVHFDADNHIYMVNGRYIPTPQRFSIDSQLSSDEVALLIAEELGQDVTVEGGRLSIFPHPDSQPRLSYEFSARRSLVEQWRVVADANSGELLLTISTVVPAPFSRPKISD